MRMKNTTKRVIELFVAASVGLVLAACGSTADGQRGAFTSSSSNGKTSTQSSTSTTGLSCVAVPSKATVASSEVFQVNVTISGASGTVSIPGTNATGSSSSMQFTTSFKNTYGVDIYWNPSITVTDSLSSAKCSFKVLVQAPSSRQL
jgi:hypothetical protein